MWEHLLSARCFPHCCPRAVSRTVVRALFPALFASLWGGESVVTRGGHHDHSLGTALSMRQLLLC